jgi:hypothetical protein
MKKIGYVKCYVLFNHVVFLYGITYLDGDLSYFHFLC